MRHETLTVALYRLLRPLARIMIRNGVSIDAAEEILRKAFVDGAEEDFKLPNRKQTDSRISVLTGLSRKKVAKYRQMTLAEAREQADKFNRAERVITAWLREPDFLDEKGDPRPLPLEGKDSFSDLVERFAGDVPVRAVADELQRIGNVLMQENGNLRLTVRGYRPKPLSEEVLEVFGRHAADFFDTLDNNIAAKDSEQLLFEGQVTYSEIPENDVAEYKVLSARLAQRFLEDLDRWLSKKKAAAVTNSKQKNNKVRLGFGAYQILSKDDGKVD